MGFRERLVPVKTVFTVLVAVLCWLIGIGEFVDGGFSLEVVVWATGGLHVSFLEVRRIRLVREWRQSRQDPAD